MKKMIKRKKQRNANKSPSERCAAQGGKGIAVVFSPIAMYCDELRLPK